MAQSNPTLKKEPGIFDPKNKEDATSRIIEKGEDFGWNEGKKMTRGGLHVGLKTLKYTTPIGWGYMFFSRFKYWFLAIILIITFLIVGIIVYHKFKHNTLFDNGDDDKSKEPTPNHHVS